MQVEQLLVHPAGQVETNAQRTISHHRRAAQDATDFVFDRSKTLQQATLSLHAALAMVQSSQSCLACSRQSHG
jgi:hypothetical protein